MKQSLSFKLISSALLLVLIVFLLLGINGSNRADMVKPDQDEPAQKVHLIAEAAFEFENLAHYVGYADHIVYGQVSDVEWFEPGSSEYTFQINRELKGKTGSKTIHVYKENNALKTGVDYLLFLEAYNGGLFPHTVYKVLSEGGIVQIAGDQVTHSNPFLAANLDPQQLLAEVEHSPGLKQQREVNPLEDAMILPDFLEVQELKKQADWIGVITPDDIMKKNKYMAFANVTVIQRIQGEHTISPEDIVYLPAEIEVGQSYLVFLQMKEGLPIVASKKGSLIAANDEIRWKEVMEVLK